MPAKVIVRDLRKHYDGVEAVRGVSFAIEPGEIFGLLGPNGAGKTTTVECLVGLREPDAGEIQVCGLDARRNAAEVKQKIGVALQSTSLQDKITPREALRLFGSFYRERAEPAELIKRFALEEKADAPVDTLSGGQRQRLALALAFVNRPELVFLDEPTTGLDPQARRELHEAVRQMKRDGYTVLFTTHYLNEAETLCDRVGIIDRGQIVAVGTPQELIAQWHAPHRVTFSASRPLTYAEIEVLPGVSDVKCDQAGVSFATIHATVSLAALTGLLARTDTQLVDLQVKRASLEEVFLRLTRGEAAENAPLRSRQDQP